MISGFKTAVVFNATLSAPASKKALTSSSFFSPPPTVKGMDKWLAISVTNFNAVGRFSLVADISKNTISSAPCFSYSTANSTGSPISLNCLKLVPLTTRPLSTSKQTMTLGNRLLNILVTHG